MEMRTGRPTGGADFPDDLSGFHHVTVFDEDFGQVEIHRVESQPMVKEEALS